jgi:hypothetical protein
VRVVLELLLQLLVQHREDVDLVHQRQNLAVNSYLETLSIEPMLSPRNPLL